MVDEEGRDVSIAEIREMVVSGIQARRLGRNCSADYAGARWLRRYPEIELF